ncbi:peroxide stress protein YaaA [Inhella gelatinilytica]|uniref:UPF0246 protein I7X43_11680 n=1 Tax=Inhella gelatinilytica TaxID=2795030 RepID=A0A931NDV8_9BURK|nr:peroxide stress protein YaaA [Inhella gelatinilytica]MBH9553502.1 peroxide stress protein YaaA [Inhella gelatinilytica]
MLIVLSPAKSLDFDSPLPPTAVELAGDLTSPAYVAQSEVLVRQARELAIDGLAQLMEISPALATLNAQRFQVWTADADSPSARPAFWAFDGDVYDGLQARTLSAGALRWAQQHVRILSGLYGLLRPLDRMQPYRLEMGRALPTPAGRGLYRFWGDDLAEGLNQLGAANRAPLVVNLASQEYFKAVKRPALKLPVVDVVFEEVRAGQAKVISFFAKRARGLMARYVIEHRLDHPDALRSFDLEGYAWSRQQSTAARWVFQRENRGP